MTFFLPAEYHFIVSSSRAYKCRKSRWKGALLSGLCRSQLSSRWLAGWLCWLAVLQASNTLRCAAGDFEAQPGWESRQTGSNPTHSAAQQRSNAATPALPHTLTSQASHTRRSSHPSIYSTCRSLSLSARDPRCLQLQLVPSPPPRTFRPRPPSSKPPPLLSSHPAEYVLPHDPPRIRIPTAARYPATASFRALLSNTAYPFSSRYPTQTRSYDLYHDSHAPARTRSA